MCIIVKIKTIKMKNKLLIILATTYGFAFSQTEQPEHVSQKTTTEDSIKVDKGAFTFNGYLDVNYFHNFNNPQNGNNYGVSGYERAFDQKAGQFQIGLVQTKITYTHKKSEAVADIVFGPHADLGNYGNVIGPLGATTSLAIKQAYFNWKATKKFTFTAGQFGTHIGYEVIDAPLNCHYSLNNLFNNGPFYHIGIKGTYAFTDKVSLMGGIVNNWDNLYDNNMFKTVIAQLSISLNANTKLYVNYIGGNESTVYKIDSLGNETQIFAGDPTNAFKQAIDFVGTFQLSKRFLLGFNGIIGQLGYNEADNSRTRKNWGGAALYTHTMITEKFAIGTRVDFLDNTEGVQYIKHKVSSVDPSATVGTDVVSGTITGIFTVADGHLLIKPEVRMDSYKKVAYSGPDATNIQQFMDSKGHYTKSSQITAGVAFIYKF